MMEYRKNIESLGEFDVVVVGGGVSGIGAAIEAARQGAKVAVIEKTQALGGMMTSGHVSPPLGQFVKNTMADELLKLVGCVYDSGQAHDMEYMKIIIARLMEENGVTLFLGCSIADVSKTDRQIHGVIITTQYGLRSVEGKVFIDATGDGVLSYLSGEKIEYGREDGLV
jgi:ribulose 1,5-bisphosphate synthetase/thiazole synthase